MYKLKKEIKKLVETKQKNNLKSSEKLSIDNSRNK
ncbi:hypothetical protein DLD91_01943 [Lactobacillus johnsonii]|nr:hypothetical protein DLD91_01943 [Lactobacillus johnsonii]